MLKVIAGQSFEISAPYAEGHVLSAAEARVLNQVRSENIGNNMREVVKTAIDKGEGSEEFTTLASKIAEYDTSYSFSMPGQSSPRVSRDPVEREALAIARDYVKAKLAEKGRKIKDIPDGMTAEDWEAKLQENYEKVAASTNVIAEAKKRVAAKKRATESDVELDI